MDMKKENKKSNNHHDRHDHGGYGVDHTTIIYLMDSNGDYITHFSPDIKNLDMVKIGSNRICCIFRRDKENPYLFYPISVLHKLTSLSIIYNKHLGCRKLSHSYILQIWILL